VRALREPLAWLLAAVVAGLVGEALLWAGPFAAGQDAGPFAWVVAAALPVAGCLAAAAVLDARAGGRRRLRPADVTAAAALLLLGLLAVRATVGGVHEGDLLVYQAQGTAFLQTGGLPTDPPSEYPPLAVLAFAAAARLDQLLPVGFGASAGIALSAATVATVWLLARRVPPWAVAAAALWPTVAVFSLVRYDALPTLLLVAGLVAAGAGRAAAPDDRRAVAAGALLGLGAAAKWFPGLAAAALAVGWWRAGRRRAAALLATATAGGFALPHLPFLADPGQRRALVGAYTFHADRVMTGESLPFLPLHLLGAAPLPERPWGEVALAPGARWVPTAVLLAAVAAPLVAAALRPRHATAWAAAAPMAFLLGNRIFSPQFVLPLLLTAAVLAAGWRAGARARAAVVGLAGLAATANWGVWPLHDDGWVVLSWLLFGALVALLAGGLRVTTRTRRRAAAAG
jgi:hypothetical protein